MDFFEVVAWCHHGFAATEGLIAGPAGPVAALFLAGLAGSPGHCTAMCGPFVMGQVSDRLARLPAAQFRAASRLSAGLLLPYHLGRVTTYTALGAVIGLMGSGVARLPWMAWVSSLLLLLAAAMFLIAGLRGLVPRLARILPRLDTGAGFPVARLTRRIDTTTRSGGFALGLALGFLPCGFLYAGLTVAAATASPLQGAVAMAGFGLGTVPSLIVVGTAGHWAAHRLNTVTTRVAPFLMLLNATMLAAVGVARLLPLNS